MRKLLFLSAITLLGGCDNAGGLEGIWAFFFQIPTDEPVIEASVTENFSNADPPTDVIVETTDWTATQTLSGSDQVTFGQIISGDAGGAFLVMGGKTYPGERDGSDWTFSWETTIDSLNEQTHDSGYVYSRSVTGSELVTFKITRDGRALKGTVSTEANSVARVEESDQWDDPTDPDLWPDSNPELPFSGQINYDTANFVWDGDPADFDPYNDWDNRECASKLCFVETTSSVSYSNSFTAQATDFDADRLFVSQEGAGQDLGGSSP